MKRSTRSSRFSTAALLLAVFTVSGLPRTALAELPSVSDLLTAGGFSAADIEKIKAGDIIRGTLPASNDRELVATLAFLVDETPSQLIEHSLDGLLMDVDKTIISWKYVTGTPTLDSFASLELTPNGEERAKRYGGASADTDLNLSPQEISRFHALGSSATPGAVTPLIRSSLLARLTAYQQHGLSGIAPYARGSKSRSAGDDLRSATNAAKILAKWLPSAYKMFLDYPAAQVPGSKERFFWSQINAHDVPTFLLTHSAAVPDGDAWVVIQRQFYVSEGYNCEQALAAFIPFDEGTAVFYVNRTSTDQVTGFGGSAKRSIGGKILASQLETIFQRIQKKE